MIVVSDINTIEHSIDSVVTVGVFDGVHIGHQEIMRTVREDAKSKGLRSIVITFEKNPIEFVSPNKIVPHIATLQQKIKLIEEQLIDIIVILPLDESIISLTANEFITNILVNKLSASEIVMGKDFAFGKGREGNVQFLADKSKEFGFDVIVIPPVKSGDIIVSSTNIRNMIRQGDIETASSLLGHQFILEGVVVHGQQIGRTIGYPTANIKPIEHQVVPGDGVYSVITKLGSQYIPGVCSIGNRPTVNGESTTIEVYLLDFSDDIYGQRLDIAFFHKLRNELIFASLNELADQIKRDVEQVRKQKFSRYSEIL